MVRSFETSRPSFARHTSPSGSWRRIVYALTALGIFVVPALLASPGAARVRDVTPFPPGDYTYQQAQRLGMAVANDLAPPKGMQICPPAIPSKAVLTDNSPIPADDAPVCFSNPADVARDVISVPSPSTPPFRELAPSIFGYRYGGSQNESFSWIGGSNLAEVSNPSICHSGCAHAQHFYSRIGTGTSANNNIQTGWVEDNHSPNTGDTRQVLTVTSQNGVEAPVLHPSWTLADGGSYAFRNEQCGSPGTDVVCMEIWNGSAWAVLRQWSGVMRCQNLDGSGHCYVHFWDEAFVDDDASWFNINGGSDGLRMQNIKAEASAGSWPLLSSGGWSEQSPYSICRIFAYYHFTFFRGTPSC